MSIRVLGINPALIEIHQVKSSMKGEHREGNIFYALMPTPTELLDSSCHGQKLLVTTIG
jgi:hypothetical protein